MGFMSVLRLLSDRTAVLFLGVGAGVAIGYAFAGDIATVTGAGASVPAVHAAPVADTGSKLPEYAHPFQQRLLATVAAQGRVRIGVFGDSFGDGVWAALYHQLHDPKSFQVIKFSQQSTGFTRYASLNLEEHVKQQLEGQPIDVAVISFGANDTQGVMHAGRYAALLSPEWKAEIGARIERYVGLLRAQGAVVYWVGLPVMRKPSFDVDISGMNAFFAEKMAKLGVGFIDTRPFSVDEKGQYAAYLPDPQTHVPRLARANDGIHMSMHGYEMLTGGLAQRIRDYVEGARKQAKLQGAERLAALAPPPIDAPKQEVKVKPAAAPARAEAPVHEAEPATEAPTTPEPPAAPAAPDNGI